MIKWIFLLFGIIFLVLSAGCNATSPSQIISPRWLDSLNDHPAYHAALTVGADGMKHFVWGENGDGYDYLVYSKSMAGEQEGRIIIQGDTPLDDYANPDIAVTDSGIVYIVWHANLGGGIYKDCYTTTTGIDCVPLQDEGQYSPETSSPKIVAFKEVVYAVYEQVVDEHNVLFYRQLRPYNQTKGRVSPATCSNTHSPSVDLKASEHWYPDEAYYILHVAFSCDNGTRTVYTNNNGIDGNMSIVKYGLTNGPSRSAPALEIADYPQRAYLTYIWHDPAIANSDRLVLQYCHIPTCTSLTTIDLVDHVSQVWELEGIPSSDVLDDAIRVAFRGYYNSTGPKVESSPENSPLILPKPDIWTTIFDADVALPTPYQVTNTPEDEETNPLVVTVGGSYAIIWRIESSMTNAMHVFVFEPGYGIRQVFSDAYQIFEPIYDFASYGDYAGGIWLSHPAGSDTGRLAWMSLNAFLTNLPVIVR